ncbi:hypothetical protein DPMN_115278 [Dreissena polymorpha]|uniref:Uncharacterized protein n=1 Tax=Dreissena polymorpha TaxID=45954 RepID=A0A9D4QSS2_DREPO|nr:hypothetical protein DPMN_115278 [Dreissena polymorpha]
MVRLTSPSSCIAVTELPGIQRAQSLQDRRDSSSAVSDTSEGGSHVSRLSHSIGHIF